MRKTFMTVIALSVGMALAPLSAVAMAIDHPNLHLISDPVVLVNSELPDFDVVALQIPALVKFYLTYNYQSADQAPIHRLNTGIGISGASIKTSDVSDLPVYLPDITGS